MFAHNTATSERSICDSENPARSICLWFRHGVVPLVVLLVVLRVRRASTLGWSSLSARCHGMNIALVALMPFGASLVGLARSLTFYSPCMCMGLEKAFSFYSCSTTCIHDIIGGCGACHVGLRGTVESSTHDATVTKAPVPVLR